MFKGESRWWLDDDSLRKHVDGLAWNDRSCSSRIYMLFYVRDSAVGHDVSMSGASSNGVFNDVGTFSSGAQTAHDLDFRNRPAPEYPDSDNETEITEQDMDFDMPNINNA
eukprot:5323829-Karenia_brevis.AAC.1